MNDEILKGITARGVVKEKRTGKKAKKERGKEIRAQAAQTWKSVRHGEKKPTREQPIS